MRRTLFLVGISVFTLASMIQVSSAQEITPTTESWADNYDQAIKLSMKTKKPLLLHFYAEWCMPCQRMEREVLNASKVIKGLSDKVIFVKINSQNHQELVQKYGVQLLPSDVFVDPEGRVLTSVTGFRDQDDYVALSTRVESRYSESRKIRENRNDSMIASNGATKRTTLKISQSTKTAIDGYSSVALRLNREWVLGKQEFSSEYKGLKFLHSSADEKATFEENPSKFAPRLLGCDPVTMWETDKAIAGNTEYGAFYNGELYMFTSAENRQLFKIDPSRYTQTRHVLKMDDLGNQTIIK